MVTWIQFRCYIQQVTFLNIPKRPQKMSRTHTTLPLWMEVTKELMVGQRKLTQPCCQVPWMTILVWRQETSLNCNKPLKMTSLLVWSCVHWPVRCLVNSLQTIWPLYSYLKVLGEFQFWFPQMLTKRCLIKLGLSLQIAEDSFTKRLVHMTLLMEFLRKSASSGSTQTSRMHRRLNFEMGCKVWSRTARLSCFKAALSRRVWSLSRSSSRFLSQSLLSSLWPSHSSCWWSQRLRISTKRFGSTEFCVPWG